MAVTTVVEAKTMTEVATVVALAAWGGPSHASHALPDDGGDDGGGGDNGGESDDGVGHVAGATWDVPRAPL